MNTPLPDRWTSRDLPVLRYIVEAFDHGDDNDLEGETIGRALNIEPIEVAAAVQNLERGAYLRAEWAFANNFHIADITERALRLTGVWPDDERLGDQLLWVLEEKVDQAATPEERGRWQRIRDSFGAAGRDFAVELAATITARSMGA